MKLTIFTDGASAGNPGPGGWGAIVASEERVRELGGGEARTTNNRMELRAAIEALRFVKDFSPEAIIIRSDSSYVINGAKKWLHGWKQNGWTTRGKKEVLNRDLWETLLSVVTAQPKIDWQKVGGHVEIPGNERADVIATSFAAGKPVTLYDGRRDAYLFDLADVSRDEAAHAARAAGRARAGQKAYSYVSLVDGVVATHKTWDECKRRVEGKTARFKKALSAGEEAAIIRSFERRR